MKNQFFAIFLMTIFVISCVDDDDDFTSSNDPTRFRITVTNAINYLRVNTIDVDFPEDIIASVAFNAVPEAKLSFALSSDIDTLFFAPRGTGIPLNFNMDIDDIDITNDVKSWSISGNMIKEDTIIAKNYLTARLSREKRQDGTYNFTLNIMKGENSQNDTINNGILVIHAQDNPLFTVGEPNSGVVGLEMLAKTGDPSDIYNWFTERGGDNGNGPPMRLSAAHSPFSPGVAYVFDSTNPLFVQGQSAEANSGVEELAEDGNNSVALGYLRENGVASAVASNTMPFGPGGSITFEVSAVPGDKLGFATMFVQSNDWLVASNTDGINLFDENGMPVSGMDSSERMYLFDAGTEIDEDIGFGMNQAPRQMGSTGDPDTNTMIRRVGEIEDLQFDKGMITSMPGVVGFGDGRGGYNFVQLNIEPLN